MSAVADEAIRHAVILAHPGEHSFNAAIAQTYCGEVRANGQEAVLRDLYRLRFDPLLKDDERPGTPNFHVSADVQAEIDVLSGCHAFTFIYPVWFGMPPAMMKGYIDRVIGSGVTARQVQESHGKGLLSAAHLICLTTSGACEAWLDEQGQMEALRQLSSRYLFRAFAMKSAQTMHIGGIDPGMSQRSADMHLHAVRERARRICAKLLAEQRGMMIPSIGDGS